MQLTNIARDVGEDARNGRVYLPRQWMAQAGLDTDAWLRQPEGSPALQSVVARLLAEADRLYEQAACGIAQLPRDCRSAILAARLIYAEIGQQLRRDGLDPCARRAIVPTSRKLVLLACASVQSGWMGRSAVAVPPLAAIAYLVDQCNTLEDAAFSSGISTRPLNQRMAWMLEMFERVEARRLEEREGASPTEPLTRDSLPGHRLSH